jgi:metallophosphoesterase (TIGR00282 family)
MNILFIGEINGKIGRQVIKKILPNLKRKLKPDLIIANADNLAHGNGISRDTIKEMMEAGVQAFSGGDHCFGNTAHLNLYDSDLPLLRPVNYAATAPGRGQTVIEKNGHKILLISLIGQVFMPMSFNNPFTEVDKILSNLAKNNLSAIIIDIHAEATSEKIAMFHYLDGRASAVIGTHTHIMTADAQISSAGTALITDVGQTGFADGVLGVEKEGIIKTFLTQIKYPHQLPETGQAIFNAVSLIIDPKTKKAISIKPITKFVNVN